MDHRTGRQRVEQVVGLRDGLGVDAWKSRRPAATSPARWARRCAARRRGPRRRRRSPVEALSSNRNVKVCTSWPSRARSAATSAESNPPASPCGRALTRGLRFHDFQEELEQLVRGAILWSSAASDGGDYVGDGSVTAPDGQRSVVPGPSTRTPSSTVRPSGTKAYDRRKSSSPRSRAGGLGPCRFRRPRVGRRHEPLGGAGHEPPVRAGPRREEDLAAPCVDDRGDDVGIGVVEEAVAGAGGSVGAARRPRAAPLEMWWSPDLYAVRVQSPSCVSAVTRSRGRRSGRDWTTPSGGVHPAGGAPQNCAAAAPARRS